jgi:hypothetical protein
MQTRSQTLILDVNIDIDFDFDDSIKHWNANKKKLSNCCYEYVCGASLKNGEFCKKKLHKNYPFCFFHKKCV